MGISVHGIPSIWVCFVTKDVLRNGSVFGPPTHIHIFYTDVPPPPPPPQIKSAFLQSLVWRGLNP